MAGLIAPEAPTFISASDRIDMVQDAERNLLYISTTGGDVLRYDLASKSLLSPFEFSGQPAGIDISPDQDKLAVADTALGGVHIVDLATGTTQDYLFPQGLSGTSRLVLFEDNQTLLVATGGGTLRELNLADGSMKSFSTGMTAWRMGISADRSSVVVATSNDSASDAIRVRTSDELVLGTTHVWTRYGVATSRDGSQTIVMTFDGAQIYNGDLQKIASVGVPSREYAIEVAYSPTHDIVYFGWAGDHPEVHTRVEAYDTTTLRKIQTLDPAHTFGNSPSFNPQMRISGDGTQLYSATDGGVNIYRLSSPPRLSAPTGGTFVENGEILVFGGSPTITDEDSANFAGGKLVVGITANAQPQDLLSIRNQAAGPEQITVEGTNVLYGGVVIGAFNGGTGNTPLRINLNAVATPAAVQALARNITFQNTGEYPTSATRTVMFQVADGDNGISEPVTATVAVTPINDGPTLQLGGNVKAYEGAQIAMAPNAIFTDDSVALIGGKLTVTIAEGATADDRLRLPGGSVSPVWATGTHVFSGLNNVGTWSGGDGGQPLVITFTTSHATPAAVQAVIRAVTFGTASETPVPGWRTVTFVVDDGEGLQTDPATATKRVNLIAEPDPPQLGLSGILTYTEQTAPVTLASSATVSDIDSTNFGGGHLTVAVATNGTANDRLFIQNNGTEAGQIGLSGVTVLYGGAAIGKYSGGARLDRPLYVQFNSACTPVAAQALIRAVKYQVVGDNPGNLQRTVDFQITDGVGGQSQHRQVSVRVVPVDDKPRLVASGTTGYRLDSAPLTFIPNARVIDPDQAYMTGAVLTIHSGGAQASDIIGVGGPFSFVDNQLMFSGTAIGTRNDDGGLGSTDLVVTLNSEANLAILQTLLRSLTFQASATTGKRLVDISLVDGASNESNTVTKTIQVTM